MTQTKERAVVHLLLCDTCCDNSGTLKELVKTGGCTCDVCGWSCQCAGDAAKQYVNRISVGLIPDEGWDYLQRKNEENLNPVNWEALFAGM
jgi:transcription elongation factor Elf1